MAHEPSASPVERLAEVLGTAGVRYVLIGGQAEAAHGSTRVTIDIDVCYARDRENLDRLARALGPLAPRLRGAPPDLPFRLDAGALELGLNFTLTTTLGDLDLLGEVVPLGGFADLMKRATPVRVGRWEMLVCALDDLIAIKRHINRPKDQESLRYLLELKRLRRELPGDAT